MPKIYFTALCKMNKKDLRTNFFQHISVIPLEGDCDQEGNLLGPLRVMGGYGFYSHLVPEQKSFFDEPFTFLCQKLAGIDVRLRGSYGEWRPESLHDLCYGRGLTGRLFKMNFEQYTFVINTIREEIEKQTTYFPDKDDLLAKEAFYKLQRAKWATECEVEKPLAEFKFSVTGRGYVCKNAGVELIAACYDPLPAEMKKRIDALRGHPAISALPVLTFNFDEIVIHVTTDQWEKRGETSVYPFCDWEHIKTGRAKAFVVSFGGRYIDEQGYYHLMLTPDQHCMKIVEHLKVIGRICEINNSDLFFKAVNKKINHYVYNIASCQSQRQQQIRTFYANQYLTFLLNDSRLQGKIFSCTPPNLLDRLEVVLDQYDTSRGASQTQRFCC